MSKPPILFVCLLLALAGCTTMPPRVDTGRQLPPDWDSDLGPEHEVEPNIAIPARPVVSPVVTNVASRPAVPTPLTTAESGMISLNRWAAQNGFGALRSFAQNSGTAYVVFTPRGKFIVQAGKLAAYWDGIEIRLGFTPQLFGEQIFLHALDIKKVVEPLLRGATLLPRQNRLVVIDPGHGGSNTGARNMVTGLYEKDYTLDWAKRLALLLEQGGWRVALTRTSDVMMRRTERVAFAEAQHADLFVSLHFNTTSDGNQGPSGLETYCFTPAGMPSSLTRGYEDDTSQVFPNNAFDGDNLRYAVRIHRGLLKVNGNIDRGVRHARFLDVLKDHNRPAVLIEGGYLSNPNEARQIGDPVYRQKLAEAVAKALE